MDLAGATNLIGSRVTGSRGIVVRRAGDGIVISDGRPQPLWVRVSGPAVDGAFPWEEVYQDDAGVWSVLDDVRTGDALYIEGHTSGIETGTICYAIPHPSEDWLIGLVLKGNCIMPGAIRIDGGDATAGYEFTFMRQIVGTPADFEEVAGWNSTDLGFNAFEANGETVTAGTTHYPGQIDFCRGTAFFFGGSDPGRVIIEFSESTPSMGELYLASLRTELVDSSGLVSWSTGATVYAFPINSGTTPTLETLYFAFRTEEEELVEGLPVYEVDRCCDSIVDQSSSGGGGNGIGVPCSDWGGVVIVTYQIGMGDTVTFVLDYIGGEWVSGSVEYDPVEYPGWEMHLSYTCSDGLQGFPTVTTDSGSGPSGFPSFWRGDVRNTVSDSLTWSDITDWDDQGDIPGNSGGTFAIVSVE